MRLRGKLRGLAVVAAMALTVVAAQPAAAYGTNLRSYARDNSFHDFLGTGFYRGVYSQIYIPAITQPITDAIHCADPYYPTSNPVITYVQIGQGADTIYLRYVDQCGGYSFWDFGYRWAGADNSVSLRRTTLTGWHTLALWQPSGSGTYTFSVDNVQQAAGINSTNNYQYAEAGIEDHAPTSTVINGVTFGSLQYYQPSYAGWASWAGQDASYVDLGWLCGRWSGAQTWIAGQSGHC